MFQFLRMVYRVLLACSAEKGRSPGLRACLSYLAAQDNRYDLGFESAGVSRELIAQLREAGRDETNPHVVRILGEWGIPMGAGTIRHFTELDGGFNLVLVAERQHKGYFGGLRVSGLHEFVGEEDRDVFDAYPYVTSNGIPKGSQEYDIAYRLMCWTLRRLAGKAYGRIVRENPP